MLRGTSAQRVWLAVVLVETCAAMPVDNLQYIPGKEGSGTIFDVSGGGAKRSGRSIYSFLKR